MTQKGQISNKRWKLKKYKEYNIFIYLSELTISLKAQKKTHKKLSKYRKGKSITRIYFILKNAKKMQRGFLKKYTKKIFVIV